MDWNSTLKHYGMDIENLRMVSTENMVHGISRYGRKYKPTHKMKDYMHTKMIEDEINRTQDMISDLEMKIKKKEKKLSKSLTSCEKPEPIPLHESTKCDHRGDCGRYKEQLEMMLKNPVIYQEVCGSIVYEGNDSKSIQLQGQT